jgi:hypothetical protein
MIEAMEKRGASEPWYHTAECKENHLKRLKGEPDIVNEDDGNDQNDEGEGGELEEEN